MFRDNAPIDPIDKVECLMAENAELQRRCDEQQKIIANLEKRLAAADAKHNDLKSEAEYQFRQRQICEAQLDVVRLIFGKGVRNE
jgi:predicted RNase H-like nuclease (RuvC/YqgF family)